VPNRLRGTDSRATRRALDLIEQRAPAGSQTPRHALVERRYAVTDRVVEIGQREKLPLSELGDDPTCRQQNGRLDLGLVARLARTCRARPGAASTAIVVIPLNACQVREIFLNRMNLL
jgi:hypothetical protein